jgi:hypothetical protein
VVEGVVMGVALPDGAVTEVYGRLPVGPGGGEWAGVKRLFYFLLAVEVMASSSATAVYQL